VCSEIVPGMTRFSPGDLMALREAVGDALAAAEPLELVAGGSKRDLGRPMQTPHTLDLSQLSGIRSYEPNELVLTAGASTPLDELDKALAANGQMLAFEPPDWRSLLGTPATRPTLGGALACNLSGPRRIKAGAARDHFLGFRAVSGRGEVFKSGGRVVKNVTGYDLSKLMAGSYGTLAALEEVTVKVLPLPEHAATVVLSGLDRAAAMQAMTRALGSPHDVSAAAYLPASSPFAAAGKTVALRLEGPEPSVAVSRERLMSELASGSEAILLEDAASDSFWRGVRDVEPFAALRDHTIWRISVAATRGAELGEAIARSLDAVWYLDWGGGLVWAAVPADRARGLPPDAPDDGGATVIRAAIGGSAGNGGGHATLIRGSAALRRIVPVFEPQPPALAALTARIREGFDPCQILNPGRMVERS
jgi:glycolate oxidase FAD binding subunit